MLNPFKYGAVVAKDSFCNRQREQKEIAQAIRNGDRLFIYAERRMGKTSLVQRVLRDLQTEPIQSIYVDLWPTDSERTFASTLGKAILQATATPLEKMMQFAKELVPRWQPSVTLDASGNPTMQLQLSRSEPILPALEEVLAAPAILAKKQGGRVVVVLDEFQRILEYEEDLVERTLRSEIQRQSEVAYLFLGSRKHLIEGMFKDQKRPLYQAAGHYPLEPISIEDWQPFIQERFENGDKEIPTSRVHELCSITEGHPFYTQHLAHALWEQTPVGSAVGEDDLQKALTLLLERESYAFITRWETLTRNQQRFLRGLARDGMEAQPFSSQFVTTHGLKTPSNAQRAAESLLSEDVIDREDGRYLISDRFFRLWIWRRT